MTTQEEILERPGKPRADHIQPCACASCRWPHIYGHKQGWERYQLTGGRFCYVKDGYSCSCDQCKHAIFEEILARRAAKAAKAAS